MDDVQPTYMSSAVLRKDTAVALLQYSASDLHQPAGVGRKMIRRYTDTVAARLVRLEASQTSQLGLFEAEHSPPPE